MFSFTENSKYNKLKILEENYLIIKSEIPSFDLSSVKLKRRKDFWYDTIDNTETKNFIDEMVTNSNWIGGWDKTNIWYTFPLILANKVVGKAEELCPLTIKMLQDIGNINVAGYSLLLPNSKLPIHTDETGPTYNSMAVNMKLTGGKCNLYIKNNNKFVSHRHLTGKAVIFDSENEHYADNQGTVERVILYLDLLI